MEQNNIKVVTSAVIPYEKKFVYVQTVKDGLWGLPAGKLNLFEDIHTGLAREVSEETNLQTVIKGFLGVWDFRSERGSSVTNRVFYSKIYEGEIKILNPEEIRDIRTFSLKEIRELYHDGRIRAGRANLEPVESFIRGEIYPLSLIHTLF